MLVVMVGTREEWRGSDGMAHTPNGNGNLESGLLLSRLMCAMMGRGAVGIDVRQEEERGGERTVEKRGVERETIEDERSGEESRGKKWRGGGW